MNPAALRAAGFTVPLMNTIENRKWPRQQVKLPVSVKINARGTHTDTWNIGETCDISVNGMCICLSFCQNFPQTNELLNILCFRHMNQELNELSDIEPVDISGFVVWLDTNSKRVGLRLNC